MHNFGSDADESSYVIIMDQQKVIDWTEPMTMFEESENSVDVKMHLGINEVDLEYVTIRKWMRVKSKGRKSFKPIQIPNGPCEEVERGRPRTRKLPC